MGSEHGDHTIGHSNCSHDHGHDHDHGACSHDHTHEDEHGHGDDHGHHGGEEFVPTSSVHDQFLILLAGICGLGLCYLMYFWATGLPLAAVTEHGTESAHQQMLDEAGLGKESEHGAEHGTEATNTESSHTDTAAPAPDGGNNNGPPGSAADQSSTTTTTATGTGTATTQTTTSTEAPSSPLPASSSGTGEAGH